VVITFKTKGKVTECDNNFAVTSQGLAQSLAKAGESAQLYGASLDNVIGYTTAIQTATKESGNVIGNSLKSTISRTFSDDSEKALANVGIAIRDISGEVRTVDQIWSDLAVKFKTLSNEQRQQIGLTIGSRYHLTRFLALMDNWDISTRAVTTSQQSLFSALEENRKHLASLESQINKVKSAGQELAYTIGENGLGAVMSGVLGVTTTFIKGLNELASLSLSTKVAITALSASLVVYAIGIANITSAIVKLSLAMKAMAIANPWLAVIAGLAAVTVGVAQYLGRQKQIKEEQDKISETVVKSTKAFNDLNESMNGIGNASLQNINDSEAQIKKYDELISKIAEVEESQKGKGQYVHDDVRGMVKSDLPFDPSKLSDEMKDLSTNLGINILQIKTWAEFIAVVKQRQDELSGSLEKGKKNSTEYQAERIKDAQTQLDLANNTNDLVKEYKELSAITEKNEQQTKRYSEVKNMLLSMFPTESKNGQIIIALLEEESKKRVELAEKTIGQSRAQLVENAKSTQIAYETAIKNMAFYQAEIDMLQELWSARSNNSESTGNWRLAEDLGMAQSNFSATKKEANSLADAISKMNDVLNWKPASVAGIGDDKKDSGSKKDKPQDPSYTDPIDALIRESNAQAELSKAKSETITKELEQAKASKDYGLILVKNNELIGNQKKAILDLNEAHNKINALKDSSISSSKFGDTSRWFDSNNEASTQYYSELNSASAETQKLMEAEYSHMEKLRKAWVTNTNEIKIATEAQKAFAKQSREDLIKSLEEQSQALSSSETFKLESSFKNLNIDQWIKDNITATSEWSDVTASLQEEISKLGTPTTLAGQIKYNELLKDSAKLASEALKAQKDYQKEVEKAKQNALFESTDANLQEIMDKIDAVDQAQQLSKGGISSSVPKIDMEIVPRIDYKSVEDAIAEIPKPNVDEYEFTPPTTFVTFIHDEFTNAVLKAKNDVADLTLKINSLGEITPANQTEVLGYYQKIQDVLTTLSKTASEAEAGLNISLKNGEISQEDFDERLKAIQVADLEVLAVPKFEMTADAQAGLDAVKEKIGSIAVNTDTEEANKKIQDLIKDNEVKITAIFEDTAALQAKAELQINTSSIHTIYVQTVEGEKPEGFAKGTNSSPSGLVIVSEKGRELIKLPNGSIYLSGNDGAELVNLPEGTQVTPNDETEKILKLNNGKIPAYAEGTGSHITDIDFLNDSLDEFSQSISDISKEIAKTTKIVAKDNTAVEKSDKKIAGYEKTLSKYLNEDGTYKDKYVGSRNAERTVARTQKNIEKETANNEKLVTKAESDQAILDAQKASKTDYIQKLIATQKALANLNQAQYIDEKISLYQEAITVASENIDELYDSIAKYKNDDGTYDDNEQTRAVLAQIKSNFETQKSAQLSIKQLVKERFEAEYEGFDKAQAKAEAQVSYLQKTLEYQKLIGASIEDQLATEQAIQEENQTKVDSLQAEKTQLETSKAEAEAQVKADLAKVDPNYTDADLANALANSQEFQQASDKLGEVNSDLIDANIAVKQTAQEIARIKFDNLVEPFKDAIADLQVLLQLLDDTDFAGSIANIEAQMAQEASIIASIKQQIAETLADTNLTAGEKATKVSDLTTQLNEAELAMKGLIDTEKDFQNKQLAKTFEDQYEAIEKTLFNGSTEQEAQDALNQRIALQEKYLSGAEKDLEVSKIRAQIQSEGLTLTAEQTALLNSQGDIEKSSLERLQKQLDIQQLQLKVKNLMDQKTIQQMTKNADGTWDFTYVADQEAIESAQEELANSQVDLINWEQNEINEADQEKLDEKSKYLARVKTIMDNALNGEYESMEEFNRAMTNLNQEYMGNMDLINSTEWNDIFTSTQTNLDNIESAYSTYVTNMEELAVRAKQALQDIIDAQAAEAKAKTDAAASQQSAQSAQSAQENRANTSYESQTAEMNANNANGNVPTVNVNKVWNVGYSSAQSGTPDVTVTDSQGNVVPVTVTRTNDSNFAVTPNQSYVEGQTYTIVAGGTVQEFKTSKTGSYAEGGETQRTGWHFLDGKTGAPERVLTSEQTASFNKLVDMLPSLDITKIMNDSVLKVRNMADIFKPVDIIGSISGILKQTAQTTQQIFNIDRLEFPGIKDGSGVESLIQGLNSYAIQYSKK